jgi:putative sterol carrier protein
VAEFLSDAWVADLARAASTATPPPGVALLVEVVVEDDPRPPTAYAVAIEGGAVTVTPGRADAPDLTLTQDRATAAAIARGELSAQVAFMAGRLRIGGDLRAVLEQAGALATMADVFATVRHDTSW